MIKRCLFIIFFTIIILLNSAHTNEVNNFKYKIGTLKNGLKFIVVERHQLPLVSFGLMVKSGSYHEKKPGIANMLASTLIYGNKYMRPSTVVSKLDFLGASIGVSATYDYSVLKATMRSNTTERVLKMISRIVRLPSFNKNILNRMKMRVIAALKSQRDEIADEVRMQFYRLLYGNHPYARNVLGTKKSVTSITRDDLLKYHKKYFIPNNSVIAVVGDITFNKAERMLKKYFSIWKKQTLPQEKKYKIPESKKRVKIINYPTTQGYVRIGHITVKRNHPMYYKLLVFNAILGGSGFGSRLTQVIREKLGLTYGIISYFYVYRKYPGYFHINFSTKLGKIKFAVKKVYEVVKKMIKEGPTKDELKNIKKYLTGTLIMQRETPSQLISKIFSMELYNLKPYFWEKEIKIINNLTLDEVKEAAKYILMNKFTVVVTADLSKVKLKPEDITP